MPVGLHGLRPLCASDREPFPVGAVRLAVECGVTLGKGKIKRQRDEEGRYSCKGGYCHYNTAWFSGKENGASDGDVLALYNCSSVGVVAAKGLVRCDL